MSRNFRARETQMQASRSLRTSVMKEKEEELALFLDMRKREKERTNLLLQNSDEFDAQLGSKPGTSLLFNISETPARKTGSDDFLSSENDKNDYDWLLTPPGTPLFPSLEMESQKTVTSQTGTPKARPTALKSRLANPQVEPAGRSNLASKQPASSPGLKSPSGGTRRPSSSGGPGSRPATPTGRPTLTAAPNKPSRPSTPTSRATLSTTKPTVPARSSTPTSRPMARSSTPTSRSSVPASKLPSRAPTPTRRSSTSSNTSNSSAPPGKLSSSSAKPTSMVTKPGPAATKASVSTSKPSSATSKPSPPASRNPAHSRGASPTVRSRAWKPSDMPGFSLDAPPNLRTTLPNRPLSANRGRPGASSSQNSSAEHASSGRPRRQSCSPSRGRSSNGSVHLSGSSVPAANRVNAKINDNVSPVVIGTKMVERVINMRKLVPPKQDEKNSPHGGNLSGKSSSSPDSSGFGRTLSKKSLDMAIRHMDIRRSIPNNLRPLMTNIPASSMYSVRSGPTRSRTVSVSNSPLATSSNASSEISVNHVGICLDGSEVGDEVGSEGGCRSPSSLHGR